MSYAPMACRECGSRIEPNASTLTRLGKKLRVATRADCIYRCRCGVAYSNATQEAKRVLIRARPELNLPEPVRPGLTQVLEQSVNQKNRGSKLERFCFETSEDAVTWTVLRYLASGRQLDALVDGEAPAIRAGNPPALLLWGVPVSGPSSLEVACLLKEISRELGEEPDRRSEPDAIVVWPHLTVVLEAKYQSGNDRKPSYSHFDRYLDRPELFAVQTEQVKRDGYYELVRNWRIGVELAERLHKSCLLINLGPPRIGQTARHFALSVVQNPERRFNHRTWADLLTAGAPVDPWFEAYARARNLYRL